MGDIDTGKKTELLLWPIGTGLVNNKGVYRYTLKEGMYQWVNRREWDENFGETAVPLPSYSLLVLPEGF